MAVDMQPPCDLRPPVASGRGLEYEGHASALGLDYATRASGHRPIGTRRHEVGVLLLPLLRANEARFLGSVRALMRPYWASATVRGMGRSVLIVDDHSGFRSAARALLEAGGFDVVGEAADGASALATVAELRPEIVLLDIQLPDIDGFAVAERLAENGVHPAIVFISSRDVTAFRRRLAANPAWSFIPKTELSGDTLAIVAG
jgi:CheY-like chemotaxis protein